MSNSCKSNSNLKNFDVIIVLGSPATDDCKAGSIMKDRVAKGIELLKLGIAKKILFTGSSVRNNCTEAEAMAAYAISNGISKNDILKETRARNTYQNAYYATVHMKKLHFTSAAIVTSEPHIKRACTAFAMFDVNYSMFPANNPADISKSQLLFWKFGERMILTHHIIFGFPK
ncbi:MAG: hypothetical protein GQ552_00065 [Flavobacteriaceae bacterium]|nr:hypothetical protein [Flavobacteriaceae bacterium]